MDDARITLRRMEPGELARLGEIDRSERIHHQYHWREGALVRRAVDIDVPPWSATGDGEHGVRARIAAWQPLLERGATLLGGFAGHVLAGIAIYRPRLAPEVAQLAVLYVSAPFRRHGVGARLTEQVAQLARADGARRLYVSATPTAATVDFYLRLGFAPTDTPHPELFAQEPDDIHMIRAL